MKQLEFLARPEREVLFGGAAGGAKSWALLMAALMFVDIPGYRAMLFRRTYTDLALPGALMDVAAEWLSPTSAKFSDRDKAWTFPSGATLAFGYLDGPRDRFRYQGSQAHFFGFDELTQIRPEDYLYLFSRARKSESGPASNVPIRTRAATNPGGQSHAFVHERFVAPANPSADTVFVPSRLEDNPYLDKKEYERALANLDEITYRQLRLGEWIEGTQDNVFKREWFDGKNRYDPEDDRLWNSATRRFAAIDTANTINETSAYSAMTIGDLQPDYTLPLRYVAREKLEFPELVDWTIEELAPFAIDRKLAAVFIEDAASGKQLIQTLQRSGPAWLRPLIVPVKPNNAKGGKEVSWKAASVWVKRGMLLLPYPSGRAPWKDAYEQELFSVPNSTFKDQADSTAILVNEIERHTGAFSQRWQALMARAESRVA